MKIKRESLMRTGSFTDTKILSQKSSDVNENDSHDLVLPRESVQASSPSAPDSLAEEKIIGEVSAIQTHSTTLSSSREPWQQSGILRQALLSISSSGQIEKTESVCVETVLPKTRDDVPTVDNIKLSEDVPSVCAVVSQSSLSHRSLSPTNDFSGPMTSLPSVSSSFSSLPFVALSSSSLNSTSTVSSQGSTLPLVTSMQPCDVHQTSPSNHILSNSSVDTVPNSDADSSVSVASVDSISPSLVSAVSSYSASSNLCQALASLSSRDDTVTVVYSSIHKVEPSTDNLIHNTQKTLPLPPMSEVKSSLTNHLGGMNQSESKSENHTHGKMSETLSGISSNSETISFDTLPSNEVNGTLSTMKLDESQNSSEFGESAISLPSGSIKFSSDNTDITSNIVIPASSDVILTKIGGQGTTSQQDISHIITIPCTIYNSSLSIPMPLPLCNGATPGPGTLQMSPTIVSNLPYSVTGISNQASNSVHANSTVTLSVNSTSNSQISTSVSTSRPVSIMSVAPSISSFQNNNMIHFSTNSISLPASTQLTSSTASAVSQEPVCYTVQSPNEILSQLSKAGVLPTMSSSQVSSILSALGPDSHIDVESDAANHSEILSNQLLPGGYKVSTLTQTDSLEMNVMQHDDKIIQLLNGQQLLEHQVIGSQLMMPFTNQTETLNSDTSLNSDELITADITESKQNPLPFPRIVAMVVNTPNVRHEKQHVPDNNIKSALKNSELKILSNSETPSKHSVDKTSDNLRDFLVLPSNIKQRKRPKRTNALREMLLGVNDSSVDENSQCKKLRRRARKSDCRVRDNVSHVKDVKISGDELCSGGTENLFTKEVGCYKCKNCPFLSIEEVSMASHVKLKHSLEVQEKDNVRHELKCPGCPNVFYTTNSLEVHLKQDHQVNSQELKAICNSVMKVASEDKNSLPSVKKKRKKTSINDHIKPTSIACSTNVGSTNNVSQILVRHSNCNITMVNVPGTLIMRNCDNGPELITNDKKILIKNQETDGCADKIACNFSNISVQGNIVKDCEDKDSKEHSKKSSESDDFSVSKLVASINHVGKDTDSNVEENVPVVQQKKKRGRPKGSRRYALATGLKSPNKDGSDSQKETIGHRCDINSCAVTMRSLESIEYHRLCHVGAEFRCPECTHTHCHWNGMSTHLWRAHTVDMELFTCDQCNYKTVSYTKLINLHKLIHGSERPFLCDSCGKGFKNRKQLRNHKTIHQPPKQKKLGECEICGRRFTNSRMLRMHLDNVHNKLRPHLCNYCGYSASSVSTLKMHMRKHTGEKPFRCQLCDYCTADHNSLRRHKMRHTGDKPYKCPHCAYACIQSSTYKAHLKTKHPGMDDGLMFSCSLCSFRSVKEENYLAHLAEHKTDVGSSPTVQNTNHKQNKKNKQNIGEQFDSVIQLVECHIEDSNNECYSMVKIGGMDSTSEVQMAMESDFEPEEITGDISEAEFITGDIGEPQEFKMYDNDLKIKSS